MPGQEVRHRRAAAAIRHVHHVDAAPIVAVGRIIPIHAGKQRAQGARRHRVDVAQDDLTIGAGEVRQGGIPGGVDEGLGLDETIALHIADDGALNASILRLGIDDAGEEAHVDAGVLRHLVEQPLERLWLEGYPAIELAVQEFRHHMRPQRSALMHGEHELTHEAADQHAFAVGDRSEGRHHARRPHAAEAAGRLGEQYFGAEARRADGGGAAGRPAAGDQDVEALLDRNVAREPIGCHRQLLLQRF